MITQALFLSTGSVLMAYLFGWFKAVWTVICGG